VPRGGSTPPPPDGADVAPVSGDGLARAKELLAAGKAADARPVLEAAANDGNADAQYLLAQLLVTMSNGAEDNASALAWLQRAASGGNADAQYLLGARYERGEGVLPDEAEAVTWYRAAARQGHSEAAERLRAIYRDAGVPMPEDADPARDPQGAASPVAQRPPHVSLREAPNESTWTCSASASPPRLRNRCCESNACGFDSRACQPWPAKAPHLQSFLRFDQGTPTCTRHAYSLQVG